MAALKRGETIVRLRGAATVNPYSGHTDTQDWVTAERLPIRGVGFEPSGTVTVTVNGVTTYRRARFLLPYGADVTESDRIVRSDGTVYRSTSPRGDWVNPLTGRRAGSVIDAEAVT